MLLKIYSCIYAVEKLWLTNHDNKCYNILTINFDYEYFFLFFNINITVRIINT